MTTKTIIFIYDMLEERKGKLNEEYTALKAELNRRRKSFSSDREDSEETKTIKERLSKVIDMVDGAELAFEDFINEEW